MQERWISEPSPVVSVHGGEQVELTRLHGKGAAQVMESHVDGGLTVPLIGRGQGRLHVGALTQAERDLDPLMEARKTEGRLATLHAITQITGRPLGDQSAV